MHMLLSNMNTTMLYECVLEKNMTMAAQNKKAFIIALCLFKAGESS